jgi:hypothetical protein
MRIAWRAEPVDVAISWDDLWLGVICQSNLEIAGSPWKVYGDRAQQKRSGGRALNGVASESESSQPNSEYYYAQAG